MNQIRKIREERGIAQKVLAIAMGVSTPTVSNWESGAKQPSNKNIQKLADYFGVSTDYILGREENALEAVLGKPSPGAVRIPVIGRVAAGLPLYTVEEFIDWEEIPQEMTKGGEEYFGLKIKGDSMEPRICNGDVVIVRRQDCCENGAIAIVLVNGDEATCKRVKYHEKGISLISLNPEYPPQFYTADEVENLPVRILGVVVELRGKFE